MTSPFAIPYSALAAEAGLVKASLLRAVESVLDSGRYILGPEVAAFESEFAAYCGSAHASGVSNGTDSMHLVLRGLNLGPTDEVITAPNSFVASAASIALAGAKAVFADIGDDGNIDPAAIEAAITPRTRALAPVHLTGRPAKMKEIMAIADKHKLFVLEDAAQAVGAALDGKRMGSWGHAGSFSLHPLKNLHAFGDGGVVTTSDAKVLAQLNLARNHGLVNREQCDFFSFNCRLDELQAAMLRVQLQQLDSWTAQRRALALRYNDALRPYVDVPDEGPGETCVWQTYVIRSDQRDALKKHLNDNGVEALVHYATPIHTQPAAKSLGYRLGDFPRAEKHVGRIISLPLYPTLTHAQQDRVVELIAQFHRNA